MKLTPTPDPVLRTTIDAFPPLPALAGLAHLRESRPVIIVDTREQTPLIFTRLTSRPGTLVTGDYSVAGLESMVCIERKSISDLVGCCVGDNRARFERELCRARGYWFRRLLIVGSRAQVESADYRSGLSPLAVLSTIAAFEVRYDVAAAWGVSPEESARMVEDWAWWTAREVVEMANDIRRGTKEPKPIKNSREKDEEQDEDDRNTPY
jgi:ERCC4-type nuclease